MGFWTNLSKREKGIIALGIPLLLLAIFYYYLWVPTVDKLNRLQSELPLKSAEYAWMKYEIENAKPWLGVTPEEASSKPILTVIESRAIEVQIKTTIQRVQPGQEQEVKMWFQEVPADKWFRFVNQLDLDGVSVDAATITRTTNGKVNIRVTFKR